MYIIVSLSTYVTFVKETVTPVNSAMLKVFMRRSNSVGGGGWEGGG